MKATEFVKKYGWDLVKRDVACLESGFITKADFLEHYGFEVLDDLKRLVESHELVREHYSLNRAKKYANSPYTAPEVAGRLNQAIADVEACQ